MEEHVRLIKPTAFYTAALKESNKFSDPYNAKKKVFMSLSFFNLFASSYTICMKSHKNADKNYLQNSSIPATTKMLTYLIQNNLC